jgi:hypothetical protein
MIHGQTNTPKIFPMNLNQSFPSSHLNMAVKLGNDLAKVQPYIQIPGVSTCRVHYIQVNRWLHISWETRITNTLVLCIWILREWENKGSSKYCICHKNLFKSVTILNSRNDSTISKAEYEIVRHIMVKKKKRPIPTEMCFKSTAGYIFLDCKIN